MANSLLCETEDNIGKDINIQVVNVKAYVHNIKLKKKVFYVKLRDSCVENVSILIDAVDIVG